MNILIPENDLDQGKRLDLYLSIKLPQFSRSHIKKTIESNKVLINEEVCFKAGYKVRVGDKIDYPEENLLTQNVKSLPISKFDLEIIFEDEDYLFINKPIGLIVHPTNQFQNDTLVNKLLDLNKDLPGNAFLRPGIVHRLDKDTSGVIVVAKNPKSLWWLTGQFADRKVKKEYRSIGINTDLSFKYKTDETFDYECYLKRSSRDRKQYIGLDINEDKRILNQGRYSKSNFKINEIIQIEKGLNLIETSIFPLTGRTHQIRVHQKENGFPIMGDPIYLSKKQFEISRKYLKDNNLTERLYLHASTVTFENYNRKVYCISAQLPESFHYAIQQGKKTFAYKK